MLTIRYQQLELSLEVYNKLELFFLLGNCSIVVYLQTQAFQEVQSLMTNEYLHLAAYK